MENLNLSIYGMHCATCAQKIEKVLAKTRGILSISVSFSSGDAVISYDEKIINDKVIIKTIEKLDYKTEIQALENETQKNYKKLSKRLYKKLIFGVLITSLMIFAGRFVFNYIDFIPPYLKDPLLLILAASVVYIAGFSFIKDFFTNVFHFKIPKHLLPGAGLAVLFLYSFILTILPFLTPEVERIIVFELLCGLTLLTAVINIIEAKIENRLGSEFEKLINLQPEKARIIRHGNETEIDVSKVKIGDTVKVKPGEKIPVDGIIIEGSTFVNEMIVAGGEIQKEKNTGDEVIAATINSRNTIIVKVTQSGSSDTVAQITEILKNKNKFRGAAERRALKFSNYFNLSILVFALVFSVFWVVTKNSVFAGIIVFTGTVFIAAPNIFALGTVKSFKYAIDKIARSGIIFRGGRIIETACKIKKIVFDKTGILTRGVPEITNIVSKDAFNEKRFLILAGSLEYASTHRFAEAIINFCKSKNISFKKVYDFKFREGEGVMGIVDGQEIIAGNYKLMERSNVQMNDELVHKAEILSKNVRSPVYVARNRELIGIIGIADTIRENAKEVISVLKKKNYEILMVTGDNEKIAGQIADELRIKNVIADLKQNDKMDSIKSFQDEGEKVAFVGDGIQDAPVLAQADLGIALGTGTDTGLEASDITVISDNLENIPKAFASAKKVKANSKSNIVFGALYHLGVLPFAAGLTFYINGMFMHPLIAPLLAAALYIVVYKNILKLQKNLF
jgi:Cu+-exporting ATPase